MVMFHPDEDTDASKLHFPLPLVVGLVLFGVSVAGSMWGTYAGIADIRTRMEMASEIDKVNLQIQDERAAAIKEMVLMLQRRQDQQQDEIRDLHDTVTAMTKVVR